MSQERPQHAQEPAEGAQQAAKMPPASSFAKVKGLLRKAEARTREALIEAMGAALSAVSARETSGFLGHCGYRTSAQLL